MGGGGALRLKFKAFTLAEGASHREPAFRLSIEKKGGKFSNLMCTKHIALPAFTLAEVLITLGIIGVVAALTLPTLIHNHNKKVIETRLKKFYSSMNQAILLSEVENGDKKDWLFITRGEACSANSTSEACLTGFYNTYLKKYLKTTKSFYQVNSDDRYHALYVYFADGSGVKIRYGGGDYIFYPYASKMDAPTAVEGRDRFGFGFYPRGAGGMRNENFYNKGVEPYIDQSWDGTNEGLKTTKAYAKLIQLNNWEIPDDYPLKI